MNIDDWLNSIAPLNSHAMIPQGNKSAASQRTSGNGDNYIRIGRRRTEDQPGDIPTQYIVVAKIYAKTQKVCWLSVATWQLNGIRIGALDAGDHVKEDDKSFETNEGLDPDPYFYAHNVTSAKRIRKHLLELVSHKNSSIFCVEPETYDDAVAQAEKSHASWARLIEVHGTHMASTEEMLEVAGQDPRKRFPRPWALPVPLTDSEDLSFIGINPGPKTAREDAMQEWLPTFDSIAKGGKMATVNVMAIFVNDFQNQSLRLANFLEVAFDPEESVDSAKKYFLEGDGTKGKFSGGLNNSKHLSRVEWSLELWVLPQVEGCSTLIKWDDVPQLEARAFCDWRAVQKDKGECDPRGPT
jgi:hypothetical protein